MGSPFRSEDMSFYDMYLHADDAYECINRLGELGICQFKDMNVSVNVFQRQFVSEIRKLDDLERIIRYFEGELQREGMEPFAETTDQTMQAHSLNDMIQHLERLENSVRQMMSNVEQLEKKQNELIELSTIFNKTREYFETISPDLLAQEALEEGAALRYTVGVMPTARIYGFTRLLYFATRGASYCRHSPFEGQMKDPVTGNMVDKSTFMVLCTAEQLQIKIKKIAEGFQANLYPCPETEEGRTRAIEGVHLRLRDLELILAKSRETREESLREIARNVTSWKVKVLRMKGCYHTLNLFRYEKTGLVGQCYLPTAYLPKVQALLNVSKDRASNIINPTYSKDLPTYHASNKFTQAFQNIIDAYGMSTYKEVNPAMFSIITFPFLFSLMFGDAGHGLLMLLFALYLVLNENKLKQTAEKSEILGIVFGGRYMILLMSIFSIYSGFMYNDVFSRSIAFRKSAWNIVYDDKYLDAHPGSLMLDPSDPNVTSEAYPFGLDPVWKYASNQITFTNSYKKKISVIFGVIQMTLGIIIGLFNHVYFKKYVNIVCEFIPMLLFLMSLFGYLMALIFAKWIRTPDGSSYYNCSPNLLIDFINMFMMKYDIKTDPSACPTTWFNGQIPLQMTLVVLALASAVWLLFSKPLYLLIKDQARKKRATCHQQLVEDEDRLVNSTGQGSENGRRSSNQERGVLTSSLALHNDQVLLGSMTHSIDPDTNHDSRDDHDHEHFEFGEVMIHQAIHTIEFCLGCVSHTASYLRLWALSLAHAQLSEVLWVMVLRTALTQSSMAYSVVGLFITFALFAVLSVVILILMEGLSAFLHTLRLHWVEFNSKFYKGEGHPFEPFSFEKIIKQGME